VERERRLLLTVHESHALAGSCSTQRTGTFQEQHELAMDRRPKAEPAALALATRGTGGRPS
jgi:hypothetical protein